MLTRSGFTFLLDGQYQPTYPVAAVSRLRTAKDSYTPPAAAPPDFSSESSNGGQPSSGPLVDALLRKLVKVEDECKLLKKQVSVLRRGVGAFRAKDEITPF